MKKKFKYGQWMVELERRKGCISWITGKPLPDYISINVTGNWSATQGTLYDKYRSCCAYDWPELLPDGLKKRIYEKAKKVLEVAR